MILIFFVGIFIAFLLNPSFFKFIFKNFHHLLKWAFKDGYSYLKHKDYNVCHEWGNIRLNCATSSQVFGCGKTLLLVIRARYIYNRYNNKKIWDYDNNCWCIQRIHIISNVELFDIPYIKFTSVQQLIDIQKFKFNKQDVTIFLLDESGAIFNSRNYRDNISTEFLTRLLQSRKHKVALYMTSQRFQFTDKILREVCSTVTCCQKWWRVVKSADYDAYDLEHAQDTSLVRPRKIEYKFIFDSDYHSYNSYQLVEDLRKDYKPNEYLDTKEILETYGLSSPDLDLVKNPSRRGRKIIDRK